MVDVDAAGVAAGAATSVVAGYSCCARGEFFFTLKSTRSLATRPDLKGNPQKPADTPGQEESY